MTKFNLLITVSLCMTFCSFGQIKLSEKDSTEIKMTCESFYSWYGRMTMTREIEIFNPQFVRAADGMTTLDFSIYRKELEKHHFTNELIESRIKNFDQCLSNLKSIPYDKYLEFQDLDQFEEINCDFSNRYEFVGGMEWVAGGDLTRIEIINKRTVRATVALYSLLQDKKNVQRNQTIILSKEKGHWRISEI